MPRPKKQRKHYLSPDELQRKIYQACSCLEIQGKRPTVASVGDMIGYSVGSHLRGMMNVMTQNNLLVRYEELHWNGRKAYVYLIPQLPLFEEKHYGN